MLALVEFTGNKDSNYWETNTRENVTVRYLHIYDCITYLSLIVCKKCMRPYKHRKISDSIVENITGELYIHFPETVVKPDSLTFM